MPPPINAPARKAGIAVKAVSFMMCLHDTEKVKPPSRRIVAKLEDRLGTDEGLIKIAQRGKN
jgi:hypothetical protein